MLDSKDNTPINVNKEIKEARNDERSNLRDFSHAGIEDNI